MEKGFIKSFNDDFDFNNRLLHMAQQQTVPAKKQSTHTSANTTAKTTVKKSKKLLPLVRDLKGGQKEMRRKQCMFEKAKKKKKDVRLWQGGIQI